MLAVAVGSAVMAPEFLGYLMDHRTGVEQIREVYCPTL